MKRRNVYRQGDVLLLEEREPAPIEATSHPVDAGGELLQIASDERGDPHAVDCRRARLLRREPAFTEPELYLGVDGDEPVEIRHPAYKALQIEPGLYRVLERRTYRPHSRRSTRRAPAPAPARSTSLGGQAAVVEQYRAAWRQHSLSTEPADHARAEEAMRALYRQAGLPLPGTIVWCGSLAALLREAQARREAGCAPSWHALAGAAAEPAWEAVWGDLERGDAADLFAAFEGTLWRQQRTSFYRPPPEGFPVEPSVGDVVGPLPAADDVCALWQCVDYDHIVFSNSQDRYDVLSRWFADLLPALSFAHEQLAVEGTGSIAPLLELARTAGAWIAYPDTAYVCERPQVCSIDEEGRLHSETGPALAWPDGTSLWALHGVPLSRQAVEHPETVQLTTVLAESHLVTRRALLEGIGWERLLNEGAFTLVDDGPAGTLWNLPLPDDEDIQLLQLPENGRSQHALIRVPPDVTWTVAAAAWTFGIPAYQYRLRAES